MATYADPAISMRKAPVLSLSASVMVAFTLAYLLFADRLFLRLDTGGRGLLPVLPLLAPVVALLFAIVTGRGRDLRLLGEGRFWLACGLYVFTSVLLPLVAVMDAAYSIRAVFAMVEGATALSMVLIGAAIARAGDRAAQSLRMGIVLLSVMQAAYALLQFLQVSALFDSSLGARLLDWDQATQQAYSDAYVLYGRSAGLFVNPNALGLWSVLAFWAGAMLTKGRVRLLTIVATLTSLLLSQSRGALAALVGTVLLWAALNIGVVLKHQRLGRWALLRALSLPIIAITFVSAIAAVVERAAEHVDIVSAMSARFTSGLATIHSGAAADDNLQARVEVWARAGEFLRDHPAGTFGPPQVIFEHSIDNEYVRTMLQGGLPFGLVFILTLVTLILFLKHERPESQFIGFAACAIATCAWTSLPLGSTAMALVWLYVGVELGTRRSARVAERARAAVGTFVAPHHQTSVRTFVP
jgi:hypothetical protein